MTKVMIAEDDLIIADMLSDVLVAGGFEVCGIARSVEQGVTLYKRHKPELALLDVRLAAGGLGSDIASQIKGSEDIPGILYATGNMGQIILTKSDGDACLSKPYLAADIVRALTIVKELIDTGEAPRPFPQGFRLLEEAHNGKSKKTVNDPESANDPSDQHDIARVRRQQAALAVFGTFALSEDNLETVLTEAARVCAESFEVPFCKVCRYRIENNDLLVEAGVGWHPGVVGCVVSRADESSPQGRAFITGEPVICADLNTDTGFILPSFYAEHGIISTLDVIIKTKEGQPWGVLEIDNPQPHQYDQYDINFVTGFANILAEAVNTSKRNGLVQITLSRMKDMVADKDRLLDQQTHLLAEKNILAQELQHRVRNNLQLVYGMLNKQARDTPEQSGAEAIDAIARRVMTLAKVYDHLLGTGLTRMIDFGGYLSSLCDSFKDLENVKQPDVSLICSSVPLMLDLDTATALGLVIAELISNSYLHAFPKGDGTIKVSLHGGKPSSEAMIAFSDNGIGFTEHDDSKRRGLSLVKRLMEQVEGSVELRSDSRGTSWTLKFPAPTLPTKDDKVFVAV